MSWVSSCLKKHAYSREETARAVAEFRSAETGRPIVHYACPAGHWHIGKARVP